MSRDQIINGFDANLDFNKFLAVFKIYQPEQALAVWNSKHKQFFLDWRATEASKGISFYQRLLQTRIISTYGNFDDPKDDDLRYAECGINVMVPIFDMFEGEIPTIVYPR